MRTMTATEASQRFSDLLDAIERGESVVVTRGNRPVAEAPIPHALETDRIIISRDAAAKFADLPVITAITAKPRTIATSASSRRCLNGERANALTVQKDGCHLGLAAPTVIPLRRAAQVVTAETAEAVDCGPVGHG